jgi:hypothetical protein
VIGAALDHDVASRELHRRGIHVHFDLAFEDDDIVDRLGAMHVRVIARRKVDHGKARAVLRRRRPENARAQVFRRLANRNIGRRAVGAPHQGRDLAGLREFRIGRGRVDQHLRDIVGVMAGDDAPDRRVLGLH